MFKRILLCLIGILEILTLSAQTKHLRFDRNKTFKIVQFTDLHYDCADSLKGQKALDIMNEVLDSEHPDLVVFTGDLIVSKQAFKSLDIVLQPCISRHIPYVVVFGNHDDEHGFSRFQLYDYIEKKQGSIMPTRKKSRLLDYVLIIKSSDNIAKNASLLYFFDSNSYSKNKSIPGYAWIGFEQIGWYRNMSKIFIKKNDGNPLPALAFFHIPLPEYRDASINSKSKVLGIKNQEVCAPNVNSGLFASIKECGDIMGVFVGHDHNNDFAVQYREVVLAYGRYTGGEIPYVNVSNGARVIILKENMRQFDSYIRTSKNVIESRFSYPDSFS